MNTTMYMCAKIFDLRVLWRARVVQGNRPFVQLQHEIARAKAACVCGSQGRNSTRVELLARMSDVLLCCLFSHSGLDLNACVGPQVEPEVEMPPHSALRERKQAAENAGNVVGEMFSCVGLCAVRSSTPVCAASEAHHCVATENATAQGHSISAASTAGSYHRAAAIQNRCRSQNSAETGARCVQPFGAAAHGNHFTRRREC